MTLCLMVMKTKIENRVHDLLVMVSDLGGEFEIPEIKFNLKGSSAGVCCMVLNKCTLRFNPKLFEKNEENFLKYTVPHELAHYITRLLYGNVKPHGKEWKNVMNLFGIEDPLRCHSFDTSDLYPWIYKCKCREYSISPKRHFMIVRGKRTYTCDDCHKRIEFVEKKEIS